MPSKKKIKVSKKPTQQQKQKQTVNIKINTLAQRKRQVSNKRPSPTTIYQPSVPMIQYVQPQMVPFSFDINNPVREDLRLGKEPMKITETSNYPPMEISTSSLNELKPVPNKPIIDTGDNPAIYMKPILVKELKNKFRENKLIEKNKLREKNKNLFPEPIRNENIPMGELARTTPIRERMVELPTSSRETQLTEGMVRNPITGQMIKSNGSTAKKLRKQGYNI